MSQSFQIQGEIHSIGHTNEYGNNGFTKREFVIKLTGPGENSNYPNYINLELVKDNCALMDNYNLGDEIIVHFNLQGRLWAGNGNGEKCFNSLQAWRVQPAAQAQPQAAPGMPDFGNEPAPDYGNTPEASGAYDDELPF
ncbi:hypothetical protein R50073_16940 [Maricurvus nonylphenolicus]|uniref:DUF3127 domain-containing protein n=1 Tax=Maricurvus nonylphenolicus TaxID=1008307 RepID=UPI0036F20C0C